MQARSACRVRWPCRRAVPPVCVPLHPRVFFSFQGEAQDHRYEAERAREQLHEKQESLVRRAERLRQSQILYETALADKERTEEQV